MKTIVILMFLSGLNQSATTSFMKFEGETAMIECHATAKSILSYSKSLNDRENWIFGANLPIDRVAEPENSHCIEVIYGE